jgi:alkylhydroperoxidase family enzyme
VLRRHAEVMQRLHDAVLADDGSVPYATRLAVATGRELPPELKPYADKVARHAYRVTDADLESLRHAGYDDDAIFELTVAVALGVGLHRRDVGLAVLGGSR